MNRLHVSKYPRSVTTIFVVYILCFLVGTYTHAAGLVQRGFLASPVPLAIGVFWDALTLLDPLAAMLLWWRPRAGIRLALAIMASDVCVNTATYLAGYFGPPVHNMLPLSLLDQALFGLFVFITAPLAYHRLQATAPTGPLAA